MSNDPVYTSAKQAVIIDELNYSQQPLLVTGINADGWAILPPINNGPVDDQPVIFEIKGTPQRYIDTDKSYVQLTYKITNHDGSNLAGGATVAPINLLAHTGLRRVTTQINNVEVSQGDNYYHYKAWMAHCLTHSKAMNKYGSAVFEGYEVDAPVGQASSCDTGQNTGMEARRVLFAASTLVTYSFHPYDGVWQQGLDLPPRFSLKLTLERASDDYTLMLHGGVVNYKLALTDAKLNVRYKEVEIDLYNAHRALLASPSGMEWTLRAGQMKIYSIPARASTHTIGGIFTHILPSMIVMGLVPADAANGTKTTNPLYFNNLGLEQVDMRVNGSTIRGRPLRPKFDNPVNYEFEYRDFLDTCAGRGPVHYLDISREQWATQTNLWVFETSCQSAQFSSVPVTGTVDLELRFRNPTAAALSLVICGQKHEKLRLRDTGEVEYYRDVS